MMLTPVSTFRIMWQYRDDLLRYNDNELHDDVYIHNHPDRPMLQSADTGSVFLLHPVHPCNHCFIARYLCVLLEAFAAALFIASVLKCVVKWRIFCVDDFSAQKLPWNL